MEGEDEVGEVLCRAVIELLGPFVRHRPQMLTRSDADMHCRLSLEQPLLHQGPHPSSPPPARGARVSLPAANTSSPPACSTALVRQSAGLLQHVKLRQWFAGLLQQPAVGGSRTCGS